MPENQALHFSIHASAKEATSSKNMSMQLSNFSIHASAKEATHLFCLCYNIINFQSTPPRRRRRYRGQSAGKAKFFNPRLREGGDICTRVVCRKKKIFNPRLREGGDVILSSSSVFFTFSIHASAKEATSLRLKILSLYWSFQSTPPRRRRQKVDSEELDSVTFSIHASAKEATRKILILIAKCIFQSTPPRRRRHDVKQNNKTDIIFNPRLREGGDGISYGSSIYAKNFQSTPPRRRRHLFL